MHVELLDLKWQKFLALKKERDLTIKDMVEVAEVETSMDESDPNAVEEPIPVEAATDEPVVASGEDQIPPATAAISPDVGIETPAAIAKATKIIGENPDGAQAALQECSN